jgi:hypothetical protein
MSAARTLDLPVGVFSASESFGFLRMHDSAILANRSGVHIFGSTRAHSAFDFSIIASTGFFSALTIASDIFKSPF